jgi:hypothetical protein
VFDFDVEIVELEADGANVVLVEAELFDGKL